MKAPSYGTLDPPQGSGHRTPDVFLLLRRCCSESWADRFAEVWAPPVKPRVQQLGEWRMK